LFLRGCGKKKVWGSHDGGPRTAAPHRALAAQPATARARRAPPHERRTPDHARSTASPQQRTRELHTASTQTGAACTCPGTKAPDAQHQQHLLPLHALLPRTRHTSHAPRAAPSARRTARPHALRGWSLSKNCKMGRLVGKPTKRAARCKQQVVELQLVLIPPPPAASDARHRRRPRLPPPPTKHKHHHTTTHPPHTCHSPTPTAGSGRGPMVHGPIDRALSTPPSFSSRPHGQQP